MLYTERRTRPSLVFVRLRTYPGGLRFARKHSCSRAAAHLQRRRALRRCTVNRDRWLNRTRARPIRLLEDERHDGSFNRRCLSPQWLTELSCHLAPCSAPNATLRPSSIRPRSARRGSRKECGETLEDRRVRGSVPVIAIDDDSRQQPVMLRQLGGVGNGHGRGHVCARSLERRRNLQGDTCSVSNYQNRTPSKCGIVHACTVTS